MIGPVSTPSSTKWTVHPVTCAPYASASRTPWAPGKLGSSAGWVLTTPAAEPGEELLAHDLHEPRGDHQVRLVRGGRLGQRASHSARVRVVRDPAHEGGHSRALGALQARDAVAVGADGDDFGAVAADASAAMASSSACRFVPEPETSTTSRAGRTEPAEAAERTEEDGEATAGSFSRAMRVSAFGGRTSEAVRFRELCEAADRQQRYRHTGRPPRDGGARGR